MFGWIAPLALLVALASFAIWRQPKVGAVIGFVALYAYYQFSSLFFLMPHQLYKDGGNGTMTDWPVWVVWSLVCIGALLLTVQGLKRLLAAR